MNKPKVAFVCVHNSCRSQIAEALSKKFASDVFESYSAGTEIKPQINQDAVRLMKQLYGIDMEATQHSKLLSDIPLVDVVVTMGCNVECPYLPCRHREDWGLDDPTGKNDIEFKRTIKEIHFKIEDLQKRIYMIRAMNMQDEVICYCSNVSKIKILEAISSGAKSLQDIRNMTGACTLGKCKELSPTKKCCSSNIIKILNQHTTK